MATTSQLRSWFPEPIVSLDPLRCDYSKLVPVRYPAGGAVAAKTGRPYIDLRVHPRTRIAHQALAATFHRHRYTFDETAGGVANCRLITGGSGTSLHAHALPIDINPSRNAYAHTAAGGLIQWGRQTDMTPEMIRAVEAIRTAGGHRVWEWGGRWWTIKDPMHFEPDTSPTNLDAGIDLTTVPGWDDYVAWAANPYPLTDNPTTPEDDMPLFPLAHGDGIGDREAKRSDVAYIQAKLNRAFNAGLTTDGRYGDATAAAVARFLPDENEPTGRVFFGNRGDDLDWALATRAAVAAGAGAGGGLSGTEVRAIAAATVADHAADAKGHPHRHRLEANTGLNGQL